MRSRDYIPLALLGGVAALIAAQAIRMRGRPNPATEAAAPSTANLTGNAAPQGEATAASSSDATAQTAQPLQAGDSALVQARSTPAPSLDPKAVRSMIEEGSPGTYLPVMLAEQNQMIMRWPERRVDALRVWIDRNPSLPDWDTNYPVVAESAFDEWQRAGFPLRFDVIRDSTATEIRIRWIQSFPKEEREKLGVTRKERDQYGWIVSAEITIATHDSEGRPLPPAIVAGTARHEIGHALGLGHSNDAADVMFPESRTTVISRADRATLHLLYILPPGSIR